MAGEDGEGKREGRRRGSEGRGRGGQAPKYFGLEPPLRISLFFTCTTPVL